MAPKDLPLLNRELGWLEFNRRVLAQAEDKRTPLLERVRFLDIFNSNLDEFFMKRVGGLKRQVMAGAPAAVPSMGTPQEQLHAIRAATQGMIATYADVCREVRQALRKNQILLDSWKDLGPAERATAEAFFKQSVFPVLTPLAVDPAHPFPFISNLSTSLGVLTRNPRAPDEELFARVKLPSNFPFWIRVDGGTQPPSDDMRPRLVSLHEVVAAFLPELFPGMEILGILMFRITRNADIEKDAEDADDLLAMVTEELQERRFARVVRLEHGPKPNAKILGVLKAELEVEEADIYELPAGLEYHALGRVTSLRRPELRYPVWNPVVPPKLADPEAGIFEAIRDSGELLVHHPYESFSATVERFIRAAAEDPKVLAIKMTLYRTGEDSPFIPLLIQAAEAGKQVVCLVELKARFDEQRNILLAQKLEKAGIHVVYGIVGLKTHCKIALVVRQEGTEVRSYCHVGTGNYNAKTALLYTDFGVFSAGKDLTDDVIALFLYLTGRSVQWHFRKLLVAPIDMKESFLRLVERETEHARGGRPARIVAKMNAMEDRHLIRALYDASQAGVEIDLIVRGFCCLAPGVKKFSENIRVHSVIGRYLEHSRVYYFSAGSKEPLEGDFFIGSADWMHRNLENRVEAIAPIEDKGSRRKLWETLEVLLADRRQGWLLQPDGTYKSKDPEARFTDAEGSHAILSKRALETAQAHLLAGT